MNRISDPYLFTQEFRDLLVQHDLVFGKTYCGWQEEVRYQIIWIDPVSHPSDLIIGYRKVNIKWLTVVEDYCNGNEFKGIVEDPDAFFVLD